MNKNVIICLALLILSFGFSQSHSMKNDINAEATYINEEIKLKNVSIEVTVDSAEEIKSTFTTKGIKELLDDTDEGEDISFKIICNGVKMSNGSKSHASYEVKGNTDNKKQFLKSIKKIRKAAIKYYHN
jgi:hypothetical protein